MDSPYRQELEVAIAAAQQASKLSRAVLSANDKSVIEKDDLSLVTVADFAIQALLTASIHHAFPNDKFVGEESADELRGNLTLLNRVWDLLRRSEDTGDETPLAHIPTSQEQMCDMIDWAGNGVPGGAGSGRIWVFDPIDGTASFVRGQMYAINIALMVDGKQTLSVVACPLLSADVQAPVNDSSLDPTGTGCILFAVKGHGAYARPLPGAPDKVQPRRLTPHPEIADASSLRSVSCTTLLDSGIDDVHKEVTENLGISFPGCNLLGWVLRWSSLALGLSNMTVWVYKKRSRYAKIWDHAGAMLLFEEVGGKVTDVDGKDIDWTAGRKLTSNYGFVAAPPSIHDTVLKMTQKVLNERS